MRIASLIIVLVGVCMTGCSNPSTKLALDGSKKADDTAEAIFTRQHDGLVLLLYRDTIAKLQAVGTLNEKQHAVLNKAWNERNLIEFWALQNEKVKTLRLVTVYQKLYSDQSIIDLLLKSVMEKAQAAKAVIANVAGQQLGEAAVEAVTSQPADSK